MARVLGIGGIFFKSDHQAELYEWYQKHLGISVDPNVGAIFKWRADDDPSKEHMTVWSIFPETTKYFAPSNRPFMINYIVDNLHDLLNELRGKGVMVDDRVEDYDYGKFGWAMDPDGNRIEFWEPK